MRLSKVDPSTAQWVKKAVANGLITSNSENVKLGHREVLQRTILQDHTQRSLHEDKEFS